MNEILSIHDLSVNYGGIEAVKGISFDVHEGEIVTLIGANGAGKSSTLRTIAGLVKPSGGTINFRGDNITGRDATTIVKKGITLVPEGRHIFPDLTVLENLKVGAYLRSDDISGDIQWVYDLFPRLRERSWQAGGTLSGVGHYLKKQDKGIHVVAVEPETSPVLSKGQAGPHKIQGIGAGFVPETLDTKVYDEVIAVSNDDAFKYGRQFSHVEGVLIGISSGAALAAAIELAKRPEFEGKNIVALLPDTGDRYLSTELFAE